MICLWLCCPSLRGLISAASGPHPPRPRLQGGRAGRGAQALVAGRRLRSSWSWGSGAVAPSWTKEQACASASAGRFYTAAPPGKPSAMLSTAPPQADLFLMKEDCFPFLCWPPPHHMDQRRLMLAPPSSPASHRPPPPHSSGEFQSPSSGSLSHTENSHWFLFYTWWCVSFHVTLSILFSMT